MVVFLFATIVVLSKIAYGINPEIRKNGNPYILVIYDLHQETNVDGNCSNLSLRAVDALMSLLWSHELLNTNTKSNVGLVVYDSCGSLKRTVTILGQHTNKEGCDNFTEIVGVTTFTRREIQMTIIDIIGPLGIVHTGVLLDSYVTSSSKLSLSVAGASMWKSQGVLTFIEEFQWKHINVLTSNNALAKTERDLFLRMAASNKFCASSFPDTNINVALANLSSLNIILFVSGDDDLKTLVNSLKAHTDKLFLVVGDSNIDFVTPQMQNNTIFMKEIVPNIFSLQQYLDKKFSTLNETNAVISEYLTLLSYCQYDNIFNHTICNKDMLKYLSSRSHDRIFVNVLAAYFNLFRVISQAKTWNCPGYDFTKCQDDITFAAISVQQNPTGFPVKTVELLSGQFIEEQVPVVLSFGTSPTTEIARITNNTIVYVNTKIQLLSSECSAECLRCRICYPNEAKSIPTVIAKDGDIILTAGFPIYEDSKFGDRCSQLSVEGIVMAQSFMYAIETVQDKYPAENLLNGVSIGALIYDTCGGKSIDSSKISINSNCPSTFFNGKSNVTMKGKFVSNIEFVNSIQTEEPVAMRNDLSKFKISSSAISLSSVKYDIYLNALDAILKSLNWTYVNVVYSEEFYKMATITNWIINFRKGGICIADEIVMYKNTDEIQTTIATISNSATKTGAIILFTSKEDTAKLVEQLNASRVSFENINLVLFEFNYVPNIPKGSLIIRPEKMTQQSLEYEIKKLSVLDNGYYRGPVTKNMNNWWVEYHERRHQCHVQINDAILYPKPCSNQPTMSIDNVDMSVPSWIVYYADAIAAILDDAYISKCPQKSGACYAFMSYDKLGRYIDSSIPGYTFDDDENNIINFTMDGTLRIPMQVIHVRLGQQNAEIKVGEVTEENKVTLLDHVYAYDSNGTSVVVRHHCIGWCPSCQQCQTTATQSVDYEYNSGDIDLLGMFPIRNNGFKAGRCGALFTARGADYLTESFMYAVNTAKTRYPYLLPGVSIGYLLVDTCSNIDTALQIISNFESCFASFVSPYSKMASPALVPSYFFYADRNMTKDIQTSVHRYGKFAVSHSIDFEDQTTALGILQHSYAKYESLAIVQFLLRMDWTHVTVVSSLEVLYSSKATMFMEFARSSAICVNSNHILSDPTSTLHAIQNIENSPDNVVVLFLSIADIHLFFSKKVINKVHVISDINISWNDAPVTITIPRGSFVIDRIGKVNEDLKMHLDTVMNEMTSQGNKWTRQFLSERQNCQTSHSQTCGIPQNIMIDSSQVVLETDLLMHALHNRIKRICGKGSGLCKVLENEGLIPGDDDFRNITIYYLNETIVINDVDSQNGVFQISNFQDMGMRQVGEWKANTLTLSKELIKAYRGNLPIDLPLSRCVGTCVCVNFNKTDDKPDMTEAYQDPEMQFFKSSAKLNYELWVFVMLAIACGGVAASLLFLIYVIYKTCVGLLNKRYIGLGVLLLLAVISVYFSVLPFMLTPSTSVCGARYLLPQITYALVYATCLTKLMSLRSYKLIGLGGEISNLNQFLTVTFITSVQIAISVQYVVLKGPFLETKQSSSGRVYACQFDRDEFLVYLIYVMLIILICALYAFTVRKEKKNMGEAIFILISSWINIGIWIAWIVVLKTTSRDYVEPTICLGLIVCATAIVLTIFLPKLHKIVKLKYDVKKSGVQNGGYKIDTEFMFDRPHTLPGGFRSSYNFSPSKTKNISTFDSTFSY